MAKIRGDRVESGTTRPKKKSEIVFFLLFSFYLIRILNWNRTEFLPSPEIVVRSFINQPSCNVEQKRVKKRKKNMGEPH